MGKPLLCLIAVGGDYYTYISPSILKILSKIFDVCILTDDENIHKYKDKNLCFDIEIYQEKIFTYFAKLLFPARMAKKHKRGAYYCDVNKLKNLETFRIKEGDEYKFTYISHWPIATFFKEMEEAKYWRKVLWFWVIKGYDYQFLKTIEEHTYYIPYHRNIDKFLYTVEEIKPIFEYTSIMNENPYSGVGNGEGLALAYALDNSNIELVKQI